MDSAAEAGWELPPVLNDALVLGRSIEGKENALSEENRLLFQALKEDFFLLINTFAILVDEERASLEKELFATCKTVSLNFKALKDSLPI